ncbi:hypothetical protein ACU686_15945 [Yinghuangia aomiensis]
MLVITTGKKKGQRPSPATVMRMLRDHDDAAQAARQSYWRLLVTWFAAR